MPMYGDQILLVLHHRLAPVTLNLRQLTQEVYLTKENNYKNYTIPNLLKKMTSNIHGRKK
jgi:hypothetical protein